MHLLIHLLFLVNTLTVNAIYDDDQMSVYKKGDDMTWAAKGYDDSSWSMAKGNTGDKIFWSRTHINIGEVNNNVRPLGILIRSFGSFEVYWDGILIGKNGEIAIDGKAEKPGTEGSYFIIPDSASLAGNHTLALRTTQSFERETDRGINFAILKYSVLITMPLIAMSYMNLMAGAFLTAAIYYLFLFINSKRRELTILVFSIICLLFCILLLTEYLKFYIVIPYTHFFTRLEVIGLLTFANAFLVPLYFTIQFNFKWRVWLLGILLLILTGIYIGNYGHYDVTAGYYSLVMLITTFIIVAVAIIKKEKGGLIVFTGLLTSVLIGKYIDYDYGLFLSFTIIVLCMLYLHSIRASVIEHEHQNALVLSSRLQLELLKKNIQPHFLRNTLTSMMDWVEESPKDGARFIQELAAEFSVMNDIAEQTLIPVGKEVELCKLHLAVMEFRKEIKYEWNDYGLDYEEFIPPAIFHTILENGITHTIPSSANKIIFKLTYHKTPGLRQYTLETVGENRHISKDRSGGTGFKYIRARLVESYGNAWAFHSESTPTGWLTTINILT